MRRLSSDSRSGTTVHLLPESEGESERAGVLPDPLDRGTTQIGFDQGHVEAIRFRSLPGGRLSSLGLGVDLAHV